MKIEQLWIDDYKNLHNCNIEFEQELLLNAIIGGNGSGKSNLLEAILHILIGVYLKLPPPFDFVFQYEAQRRQVRIAASNSRLTIRVDEEEVRPAYFAERLRGGPSQVYYPELTFVYYSGECQRVRKLIARYHKHFSRLASDPEANSHRPLFVESTNQQAKTILLALIAHGQLPFLSRLKIASAVNIKLVLCSPKNFNPKQHEPKLWDTIGAVRKIIAAIDETAVSYDSQRIAKPNTEGEADELNYSETRTYSFAKPNGDIPGIQLLAQRLEKSGDNLYLALEHLKYRGILKSVHYELIGEHCDGSFDFDHLSEGEKQLIAVIGAIRLTNQHDNLVLLDEPDTHLNPHWSWEYPEMLSDALDNKQKMRSTVLMATHDPVMISGLTREQVWLAHSSMDHTPMFTNPIRSPRGQGVANLLCSLEFFGLPSSLDKETQKLMDERLKISVKTLLSPEDKRRLSELNDILQIISPGVSEVDPDYAAFLRQRYASKQV